MIDTALCKCIRYKFFVESRTPRGSQQKIWLYLSAKRCIAVFLSMRHGGVGAVSFGLRSSAKASATLSRAVEAPEPRTSPAREVQIW